MSEGYTPLMRNHRGLSTKAAMAAHVPRFPRTENVRSCPDLSDFFRANHE